MSMRYLRPTLITVTTAVALAGCSTAVAPVATPSTPGVSSATTSAPTLDTYGLAGLGVEQIIDRLDATPVTERRSDLMASIRPTALRLSRPDGSQSVDVAMPEDKVYVSVAPYRKDTHECHFHSLTTCQGELGNTAAHIKLTTSDGAVLLDEKRTTFDNGFVGLWVPRGIEGDLVVTVGGQQAKTKIATIKDDDATCVTTLKLS